MCRSPYRVWLFGCKSGGYRFHVPEFDLGWGRPFCKGRHPAFPTAQSTTCKPRGPVLDDFHPNVIGAPMSRIDNYILCLAVNVLALPITNRAMSNWEDSQNENCSPQHEGGAKKNDPCTGTARGTHQDHYTARQR
jgi:hypothetical protein